MVQGKPPTAITTTAESNVDLVKDYETGDAEMKKSRIRPISEGL